MVFEYILRQNGIEPSEVNIDQSIDFGSTAAAFAGDQSNMIILWNLNQVRLHWRRRARAM